MQYRVIWEAPLHEWSMFHTWLIFFACIFLVSAVKEHEADKREAKKDVVKGIVLIGIALFCFFNNLLLNTGTCEQYHNGCYYVVEGKISDYNYDGTVNFKVKDTEFTYKRGPVGISRFSDMYNDIRRNGQQVRIAYCRGETETYGRIAKIELAE